MIRPKIVAVQTAALAIAISVGAAMPASAQATKQLGKFNDWEAYIYSEKAGKVCYLATQPKRSLNADKDRKGASLTVTFRTSDKSQDVFSYAAGFALKKDSAASADVGGMKFDLFTHGDSAWAKDTATDRALSTAMAKGKDLIVKATPAKGSEVTDSFSLNGFGPARAEAAKACGFK